DLPESVSRAGSEADLAAMALRGRPHDGGSGQRARLSRYRHLRQVGRQGARRAAAPRSAVEIRVQIDQVDRAVQFHGSAAEELLGSAAGIRIWILGERESAGTASALEPGDGRADRAQRAAPDFAVQRLW